VLQERSLKTPFVRINYAEGPRSGPPFVLLHGGSARWQHGEDLLAALAHEWHVVAPDLRGHGRSAHTPDAYRVRDYVGDVAFLIRRRIGEPSVVYGHSRGGEVAVMLAALEPELVRGLIVGDAPLSPEGSPTEQPDHRARNELWRDLAGRPAREIEAGLREMPIVEPGATGARPAREVMGEDSDWFAWQAETLHRVDPDTLTSLLAGPRALLEGYDPDLLLPAIRCPVLLLQADPAVGGVLSDADVALGRRLLRDVEVARLAGIDHALHSRSDQLDRVLAAMGPFLAGLRQPTP
jgi:pimeloyl-ACP methyl ester carboxylesterase